MTWQLTKIDQVTEKIEQDFDVQAAKMDKREVLPRSSDPTTWAVHIWLSGSRKKEPIINNRIQPLDFNFLHSSSRFHFHSTAA